jgi:hypothetical protein
MKKGECILIDSCGHVLRFGTRQDVFRWLNENCSDGEYAVRGPGIDMLFYRINSGVYPCGGSIDGTIMPTRSLAECGTFCGGNDFNFRQ